MHQTILIIALALAPFAGAAQVIEEVPVDEVWSGHPVAFALLTAAPHQLVAYYNADRSLVVASRALDETTWERVPLSEKVVWDSHNYITMAVDDANQLHLSGNMHVAPLVYFKTTNPMAISTFSRVKQLVGVQENRMTYPRFFRGPAGEFIYTYRDGSSGDGNQIFNVYDEETESWRRLLDEPLTDGQGERNAYLNGPTLGPDGFFHVVWVWRETPDCATNHDLSYMRSRDLRQWENIRGETLALPVTLQSPGTIVDPVPPKGGLINGNATFGFDLDGHVVVTYHKYDENGFSQVYNARWNGMQWDLATASRWDTRWEFEGGGAIPFDVRVQPIQKDEDGRLFQEWRHWQLGRERWRIDPATLIAVEKLPLPQGDAPDEMNRVNSTFPGMKVQTASDLGRSPEADTRYLLRWETLGPNRDRPREPPLPPPSTLVLLKLRN